MRGSRSGGRGRGWRSRSCGFHGMGSEIRGRCPTLSGAVEAFG